MRKKSHENSKASNGILSFILSLFLIDFLQSRYNPNCRPMLEEYVQYQIDNRVYDFDANMALLKMYQFDPSNFQGDKVADILLLALTNLPKSDFLLCKYLLDTQKVMIWNSFFLFFLLDTIDRLYSVSRKCTNCRSFTLFGVTGIMSIPRILGNEKIISMYSQLQHLLFRTI